jgi:hypothetical protein
VPIEFRAAIGGMSSDKRNTMRKGTMRDGNADSGRRRQPCSDPADYFDGDTGST